MPFNLRTTLLRHWHALLSLPRQSPLSWHQTRIREELVEARDARSYISRLSEVSDVYFCISRARYDGFPLPSVLEQEIKDQVGMYRYPVAMIYAYMLGKFTSRCLFYLAVAKLCGVRRWGDIRAVVNPSKDEKLEAVAASFGVDGERFKTAGHRLLRVWPLLP